MCIESPFISLCPPLRGKPPNDRVDAATRFPFILPPSSFIIAVHTPAAPVQRFVSCALIFDKSEGMPLLSETHPLHTHAPPERLCSLPQRRTRRCQTQDCWLLQMARSHPRVFEEDLP